jgi:hypothetical protein
LRAVKNGGAGRCGNKITDGCLREIATLKNLTYLDVDSTGITDAGLKQLRESLRNSVIRPQRYD